MGWGSEVGSFYSFSWPGTLSNPCASTFCVLVLQAQQSQPFQDDIPACPFVGIGKLGGVGARKMIPAWTLLCMGRCA